jgi:hypothetical protein
MMNPIIPFEPIKTTIIPFGEELPRVIEDKNVC